MKAKLMEKNMKSIDLWMVAYQRKEFTRNAINYLYTRTDYPYRLFVVDNGSTDGTTELLDNFVREGIVFRYLRVDQNVGIHMAHNIGLSLVDSDYCISTDNDIYVPDLRERDGKCWLTQLVERIDNPNNRNFAAIACQPHVFLGAGNLPEAKNGVHEAPMAGAVMRLMRTDVIKKAGGWDRRFDANRNHEEKTICSRIQSIGGKVGYAENITCYHDFGDDENWGYQDIHPHEHGHRIPGGSRFADDPEKKGEIWPGPKQLQIKDSLDQKTWLPK